MPVLVGAIDFEGGEALHGLEEHAAQINVAAPVLRTDLFGVAHDHHDGDGNHGHTDQQQRGGKAGLPHKQDKQGERCQTRKEELRQIATKVDLQLRGALDTCLHGLGGRDGLGIGRAERAELVVHDRAHAAHGGKGRAVAHALREIDARGAQDNGAAEYGQRAAERRDSAGHVGAASKDALDQARKHPHNGDVAGECDPFEYNARNDVGGRLGNEGEEALLEHGTSGFMTVLVAGLFAAVNRNKQVWLPVTGAPVITVSSWRGRGGVGGVAKDAAKRWVAPGT